jgi:hypothetical protein
MPAVIGNLRLAVTSYPPAWVNGTDAAEVQAHLTHMSANPGFTLVSQQPVSQAGLEGLEIVYRMPTSWGESIARSRIFRLGGDLIVIEAVASNPEGTVTPEQLAGDPAVESMLAGFLWSVTAP